MSTVWWIYRFAIYETSAWLVFADSGCVEVNWIFTLVHKRITVFVKEHADWDVTWCADLLAPIATILNPLNRLFLCTRFTDTHFRLLVSSKFDFKVGNTSRIPGVLPARTLPITNLPLVHIRPANEPSLTAQLMRIILIVCVSCCSCCDVTSDFHKPIYNRWVVQNPPHTHNPVIH